MLKVFSLVLAILFLPPFSRVLENYLHHLRWTEGLVISLIKEFIVRIFLILAHENLIVVNRLYIMGASILNDNYTAWFNNEALHSPAISLAAMHNALLRTFANSTTYRIDVMNHPLPFTDDTRVSLGVFRRCSDF